MKFVKLVTSVMIPFLKRAYLRHSPLAVFSKKCVLENFAKAKKIRASVSFLVKLQAWGLRPPTLLKKRLWQWWNSDCSCNRKSALTSKKDFATDVVCKLCKISWKCYFVEHMWSNVQKQSSEGVMYKRCLKNFAEFTGKHLCQILRANFIKKETLAQVFFYEFCKISKNTFFRRTPLIAAS